MKNFKILIKKIIKFLLKLIVLFFYKFKSLRYFLEKINENSNKQTKSIKYNEIVLQFYVPNRLNLFRVNTFAEKEPETLSWIDSFASNTVFWDIGANIGLYSCYAVKKKKCKVYAFEPSVFNLEILSKNIFINNISDYITILSLPLSNNCKETKFNMSSIKSGSSISTFGENYKFDGSQLKSIFDYRTIGISMDETNLKLNVPMPKYIKLDVDGIEHLILKGGKNILKNVAEILIEVDEKFVIQSEAVNSLLKGAGLNLVSKNQSDMMKVSDSSKETFNQIWKRKNLK